MQGIRFLTDEKDNPTAVQIDLKKYGRLWEDIYDNIIADKQAAEPTCDWEEIKDELRNRKKRK